MKIHGIHDLPRRIADKLQVEPMTGCWIFTGARSKGGRSGNHRKAA